MPALAFTETSQQIVKEFLNTVVLVDDRAYLGERPQSLMPAAAIKPGRQGSDIQSQPTASRHAAGSIHPVDVPAEVQGIAIPLVEDSTSPTGSAPLGETDHTLNVKTVIDAFGTLGIVCSVVRPSKDELAGLNQTIRNLGPSADVVILDWVLYGDQTGTVPLELIEVLASTAKESGTRARLVVVYTAEANLADISSKIRQKLAIEEANDNSLDIVSGGLRICVYGKEGLRQTPINKDREVTAAQLPGTVIAEFAQMTKGLLSNMAMKSITAIRSNTFQLISRFRPELDASFVTHGTLISPEQASEQIPSLIVSEIREILEDVRVSEVANYDHVVEWLKYQVATGLKLPATAKLPSEDFQAGLLALIQNGIGDKAIDKLSEDHKEFFKEVVKTKNEKKYTPSLRNSLTSMLVTDPSTHVAGDAALTMLMSLRHRYDRPSPQLALGSILGVGEGLTARYILCLQPVCDSVRLESARAFPFVPLEIGDYSKVCDVIVKDQARLRFLTLKYNPYRLEMLVFEPTDGGKVIATHNGTDFVFTAASGGNAYRWIAELKPAHAQRVANLFASTFSRVGLDESEWGRLGSKSSG